MKKPLKYTLTITAAIAAVFIAAILLIHFIDLDPFRGRIESMVSGMIGRRVQIEGHMDVNLFPYPKVILNNVSLANADWGTEPAMVRIGHVDASIIPLSLFSDTLIIRQVRLSDAAVLLEKKDGQPNLVMGAPLPSPPGNAPQKTAAASKENLNLPLYVDNAEFSNISLILRSPGRDDQTFRIASFTLRPDSSGDVIVKSSGEILGRPMALQCTVNSGKSVMEAGAVTADFEASLLDAQLTGRVTTGNWGALADLHGSLRVDIDDIRKVLRTAEVKMPFDGPFRADATVEKNGPAWKTHVTARVSGVTAALDGSGEDKRLDFDLTLSPLKRAGELFGLQGLKAEALNIAARVTGSIAGGYDIEQLKVKAGQTRLSASGRIRENGNAQSELSLESPDLSAIMSTLPAIPIQAEASIEYTAEKIAVSNLSATLDESDIIGNLALERNDKPHITADLSSKKLDLGIFSRTDEPAAEPMKSTPAESGESRYVFKETPLPLSVFNEMEADITLSVGHIDFGKIELKDAVVNAALHEENMETKIKFDSLVSGRAAARLGLQTKDNQAVVDTLVSLSNFRLGLTGGGEMDPKEVPPLSMTLDLKTTGASPRQMASAANGRALITSGPGKTSSSVVKMVSNDILNQLLSALNPFAEKEKFSSWDCSAVNIDIVHGDAEITPLLIQGEKVMVGGGGKIDLGTEALDLEFNTKPRSGVGISAGMFVTPFIKAKGTLAKPAIGLNEKGTLLTSGAAIATGGMSFLIKGVYDRVTVEGDRCEQVLKSVGEHTPYSF